MGSVGPDDDDDGPSIAFIPKQSNPEQDLKDKLKASSEAGLRKVLSAIDVLDDDEKLSWVLQDTLPDTGLMYIAGASGTGKTILAIQLIVNIILGRPTMTWQLGEAWHSDFKCLMLSLEMNKKELQLRLQHMCPNLNDEDRKELHKRFLTYTEPEPFEFWNSVHIVDLIRLIKEHNINLLLVDTASVSFAEELTNQKQVNDTIKNLYMLRSRLNMAMVVVAHTKKPQMETVNNPETASLHQLFGHSAIANSASSIILMLEDEDSRKGTVKSEKPEEVEKLVHIVNAKARFGANSGAFKAHLTSKKAVDNGEPLMFRRNAIPIPMTDEQRRKANKAPEMNLKSIMADTDFGSFLDGDE